MRIVSLLLPVIALSVLAGCNGGGSQAPDQDAGSGVVSIRDIILDPASPGSTALVELTIDAVATVTPVSQRTKLYAASGGTLYEEQPDFSLVMRGSAQTNEPSTISTKSNRIYWITPASGGKVTLSITISGVNFNKEVVIGNSLATLSVGQDDSGRKVVTVTASNVEDLFQAAFRVNYKTSKYTVVTVEQGDFLGSDALFIGEKSKTPLGVVAVSLSRKRGQGGVSGSGVLARVIFAEKEASAVKETSVSAAFSLEYITLLDSSGIPLGSG